MELENRFKEKLKREKDLKKYSTFMIGGQAKYFLELEKGNDVKTAIESAIKDNIPFYIIGFGSNTLLCDGYFDGLVIVYKSNNPSLIFEDSFVKADAAVPLYSLVSKSKENGLSGLEWAIGIPGTLGGAINGNAGAFGKSISDSIESVEFIEIVNREIKKKEFSKQECGFDYRQSVFKENNNLIILSAKLKLEKKEREGIEQELKINLEKRKNVPKGFSVGSVFKNYFDKEKKEFVSAGKLIEECGLRGKRIGDAQISNEHGNFIINLNKAKARDVIELISLAKKEVENKFFIKLEEEIKFFNCENR